MRYTFTVGIGLDKDGYPVQGADALLSQAMEGLATAYGGVTAQHGQGGWISPQGKLVSEPCVSFIVERVLGAEISEDKVRHMAEFLRELFGQSCIVVSITHSDIAFV